MRTLLVDASQAARLCLNALVLLGLGFTCTVLDSATPGTKLQPLTPSDLLKLEGIGRVVIAGDRYVVFERLAPPESAPNMGTYHEGGDKSAFAKLFVLDLDRRSNSEVEPLFEQSAQGGHWIGALSPDESKLAAYSLESDVLKAGVFEFSTKRLTWFDFTPNYEIRVQRPVWIGEDELIYPTLPPRTQPASIHGRRIAARLNELWSKTFKGRESSATVLRSPPSAEVRIPDVEFGSLVRANVRTGENSRLAEGSFYALRVSPDRRYLAAIRERGRMLRDENSSDVQIPIPREQLVIFDLKRADSAPRVLCDECVVTAATIQWSQDAERLVFSIQPDSARWKDRVLMQYDLATHQVAMITPPADWVMRSGCGIVPPLALPIGSDGRLAAFLPQVGRSRGSSRIEDATSCTRIGRFDWFIFGNGEKASNVTASFREVAADPLGINHDGLFVLLDGAIWKIAADGSRTKLHGPQVPTASRWTPPDAFHDESAIVGSALPHDRAVLSMNGKATVIPFADGRAWHTHAYGPDFALRAISRSGRTSVVEQNVRGTPVQLAVIEEGREPKRILSINPRAASISPVRTVTMKFEYAGEQISSCLVLPPDAYPNQRHPTIVDIYPYQEDHLCPYGRVVPHLTMNLQVLVARGYAVMNLQTPRRLISRPGNPLAGLSDVTLAAVEQAVKAGYADPQRLGILGVSQGQHACLQILTESDRFKAAVVVNGLTDLASHYGTQALRNVIFPMSVAVGNAVRYESDVSPNYMGAPPWQDPEAYIRNSPVFQAERIHTPLLIMHSDFDKFPLGQSQELFSALYRLRKEAMYVTYWGEGHTYTSPGNVLDMWSRIFSWYDRHLLAERLEDKSTPGSSVSRVDR